MDISDDKELFFIVPKAIGGKEIVSNMAYVHSSCQKIYTERRSKE